MNTKISWYARRQLCAGENFAQVIQDRRRPLHQLATRKLAETQVGHHGQAKGIADLAIKIGKRGKHNQRLK